MSLDFGSALLFQKDPDQERKTKKGHNRTGFSFMNFFLVLPPYNRSYFSGILFSTAISATINPLFCRMLGTGIELLQHCFDS